MVSMIPHRRSRGSPPRMRGKVIPVHSRSSPPRITPAYAGKSCTVCQRSEDCWDHPRVCGEKTASQVVGLIDRGSPPRMRGKGQAGRKVVVELGITPACAGKSIRVIHDRIKRRGHPRVCGEKCSSKLLVKELSGSPPRMRGKVKNALLDCS